MFPRKSFCSAALDGLGLAHSPTVLYLSYLDEKFGVQPYVLEKE